MCVTLDATIYSGTPWATAPRHDSGTVCKGKNQPSEIFEIGVSFVVDSHLSLCININDAKCLKKAALQWHPFYSSNHANGSRPCRDFLHGYLSMLLWLAGALQPSMWTGRLEGTSIWYAYLELENKLKSILWRTVYRLSAADACRAQYRASAHEVETQHSQGHSMLEF